MKLSLSSCVLNPYLDAGLLDHAGVFRLIRECGFTHTDLDISNEMLEGDVENTAHIIRDQLDEAGLTASMSHSPSLCSVGDDPIGHCEKALRFCQAAGIPSLVVHPFSREGIDRKSFFDENAARYAAMIPFAEKTGVQVLIENIGNYADPYYLWTGSDLRELVEQVSHPLVNACWDVGHANHFWPKDCDQYESITALGERLTAIHVHDNCGYFEEPYKHHRIDMHMLPYASIYSSVNFDAVILGLKDVGFKGTFNFEVLTGIRSGRAPFVYRGETVHTLEVLPPELWSSYNRTLYLLGKHMLGCYGEFEG